MIILLYPMMRISYTKVIFYASFRMLQTTSYGYLLAARMHFVLSIPCWDEIFLMSNYSVGEAAMLTP